MTGRRLQFGVAVLEGKLHVVGGRDGFKTLNTVECYDTKTSTWSSLPPMSTHRHGLGENLPPPPHFFFFFFFFLDVFLVRGIALYLLQHEIFTLAHVLLQYGTLFVSPLTAIFVFHH